MISFEIPKVKTKKLKYGISMLETPIFMMDHPIMALTVAKKIYRKGKLFKGVVREIIHRQGDPSIQGFIDRSILYLVESNDLIHWEEIHQIKIRGIEDIINNIKRNDFIFIGLEDPDIYIDKKNTVHLFFTIAFKVKREQNFAVFLGHASGPDLENLTATLPVLAPQVTKHSLGLGYKEVSLITDKKRSKLALAETGCGALNTSIVVAEVTKLGKPWKLIKRVLDPLEQKFEWIQGELSPGPIFPEDFVSYKGFSVGLFNGRSPAKKVGNDYIHGKYAIGVMIVDKLTGEIPWVSPEPFIEDPAAKSITFVSDFVQTGEEKGLVYAHVDDSLVRAYILTGDVLRQYLDKVKIQ